jgi:hypothetical protein
MKISRNFTLVLFLGAVAVIFFGVILMRGHKNANRVSSANQPFFLFGSPQTTGRQGQIQQPFPFNMPQQGDNMETPPYVPVASVSAPTGVATALPFDLMKKLTVRVPFAAQYHIDISSKYSTVGYSYQQGGRFMPRPKQEAESYEGFYALDGNNITIKEDDAKDNLHHVYALKDNVSYEREKSEMNNNTCVMKDYDIFSLNPNFDLCSYPSFWISAHFPSSPEFRILKQNGKYIYTNVIAKTTEDDYTIEIVDGAPRLSSIVNRTKILDNYPWHADKKEVFSNFTKVGGAWLPRSISITGYQIGFESPIKGTSTENAQKQPRASLEGITKTQITISSIKIGKPSPKYFDWRNYAVNGETARNFDETGKSDEHFVINTKNPDLWAQANAYQNKLGEYAKNPVLRRITFTKPFMAQYKQNSTSHGIIKTNGIPQSITFNYKTISTFSFNGKILLVRTEIYMNNHLQDSTYSLTDPQNNVTLRNMFLELHSNRYREFSNNQQFLFLPYNLDWNSATLSAPLSAAPATLSAPNGSFGCQCQVALDQGSPKVLQIGSSYRLIDNVWIPGQIGSDTKLVYFKPVMPPASDFDLLSVIKHNITEKSVMDSPFDIVGNSPGVKGVHKMIIEDLRPTDQDRGVRQLRRRIIDLDGSPILQQISSGQARLFDNSKDSKSYVEFFKAHPRGINSINKPIILNRNQIR